MALRPKKINLSQHTGYKWCLRCQGMCGIEKSREKDDYSLLFVKNLLCSLLITASKRQRASASYDDAPSCQVHRAQNHAAAGEQQPCHTSFSPPSPIPLFVLIGTHVFINPFLHLLIYLLNKNSCSLEGGSKYCLEHICWHLRFNLVSVMNCGAHSVTAAAPENQSRWGKWRKKKKRDVIIKSIFILEINGV